MSTVTFKATSKLVEGLQVDSAANGFSVRMDEPQSLGGTNTGMNPVEALLTSFGSCLTIVASAFAKSQGIDLQEFSVDLEGDLDPDGFLKGKPGVRNGFNEIRFTPHIKSSSSAEEIEKFIEFIKSRCPVSDNLTHGTTVVQNDPVII